MHYNHVFKENKIYHKQLKEKLFTYADKYSQCSYGDLQHSA